MNAVSRSTDTTPKIPLCGPLTLSLFAILLARSGCWFDSFASKSSRSERAGDSAGPLRMDLQPAVGHVDAQASAAPDFGAQRAVEGEDGRIARFV